MSSREEAALWRPAEQRRWWATALAPVGWVSGHIPSLPISWSGASAALAGGVFVTGVAGIGVIAYLLVQGGGADGLSAPSAVVQAHPTPTATTLPLVDVDAMQQALEEDEAKGWFEGELGDFLVLWSRGERTEEANIYRCAGDEPYIYVSEQFVLQEHELWSDAFGANGSGFSCAGEGLRFINNSGQDEGGGRVQTLRAYVYSFPYPDLHEAPRDRLELIEVEGHPALIEHPVPEVPWRSWSLTVLERAPDGDVPGIVVRVMTAPSSKEAIALAEALMR